MKQCIACGMPLTKPEDCAGGDMSAESCIHCTSADGTLKSCADIFDGGISFFMNATGSSREEAQRLTRRNMKSLDHWKANPCDCLEGEEATDEKFRVAFEKLSSK